MDYKTFTVVSLFFFWEREFLRLTEEPGYAMKRKLKNIIERERKKEREKESEREKDSCKLFFKFFNDIILAFHTYSN